MSRPSPRRPGEGAALEGNLAAFEAQQGSQIAVLIVPTTQPEDIAQFGIRVAEQWKIGREKIDDGGILIGGGDDGPFVMLIVGGIVAGWLLSMLMSRPAAGGIAALGSGAVGAMLLGFTPVLLFIAVFVFAGVASGFRHGGGWSSGGGRRIGARGG